jgi:Fe-S cluster assembly iron-binding protein IscA
MLNITEKAQTEVARYFESNPVKPIRVFLDNGCCGAQLAMAIDEAKPDDKTFNVAGIDYLVNQEFLTQAQPIEIDYAPQGFKITSSLELGGDCGGCGSSGNCCG